MSIHVHKTGLNKTLGHQSDAIFSTNLIGEFRASTGAAQTHYWVNQTGGNDLRKFNGISKTNSGSLHYWVPDGTNDYLGEASSGYGGSPFLVNTNVGFTIAQWYYHGTNLVHPFFSFFHFAGLQSNTFMETGIAAVNKISLLPSISGSAHTFDFTLVNAKWYYVALTYSGVGHKWTLFINGSFIEQITQTGPSSGSVALNIGLVQTASGGSLSYSNNGIRFSDVHVYSAELKNSQIRQNFLAGHDINDYRHFGTSLGSVA
tara:strand:- start:41 stop:820 length:780 start_codon:yes stop_codon:yes gene_type:complete